MWHHPPEQYISDPTLPWFWTQSKLISPKTQLFQFRLLLFFEMIFFKWPQICQETKERCNKPKITWAAIIFFCVQEIMSNMDVFCLFCICHEVLRVRNCGVQLKLSPEMMKPKSKILLFLPSFLYLMSLLMGSQDPWAEEQKDFEWTFPLGSDVVTATTYLP